MKRSAKSMLGVTLLEIMLVLAIAAMVIVMSIRYYQSATANQQANAILQMFQTITANADGLAQGTGSYSGTVTTATIQPMMPNNSMTSPWGSQVTIPSATANTYTVSVASMPAQVCGQVRARLSGNPKYTNLTACQTSGVMPSFSYTYDVQQ